MKKILGVILMGGVVVVMALNVSLNTPNVRFLTLSSLEALANESGSSENCDKPSKCTTTPGFNEGTCKENLDFAKGWNCVLGTPHNCDGEVKVD